jgi:uncharacterized protein (DUF4415 family)
MSVRRTTTRSTASERPVRGRADLARLRNASDDEISRTSPAELKDIPASFWDAASVVQPVCKQAISLRLDRDVLAWFKGQGPRYQSRINAVLRSYVAAMQAPGNPRGPS